MNLSPLQKARYEYSPKLPGMLRNGIDEISVKEGAETQSVADQDKIKALFPNTYGKKEITFEKGKNTSVAKKQVVGVKAVDIQHHDGKRQDKEKRDFLRVGRCFADGFPDDDKRQGGNEHRAESEA